MTDNEDPRSGERFLTWLARAAIESREASGERRESIAYLAGVGIDQVSRFEKALSMPREAERVIAAYAQFEGADPLAIYERAIAMWREHGTAPVVPVTPVAPRVGMPERPRLRSERASDQRASGDQ